MNTRNGNELELQLSETMNSYDVTEKWNDDLQNLTPQTSHLPRQIGDGIHTISLQSLTTLKSPRNCRYQLSPVNLGKIDIHTENTKKEALIKSCLDKSDVTLELLRPVKCPPLPDDIIAPLSDKLITSDNSDSYFGMSSGAPAQQERDSSCVSSSKIQAAVARPKKKNLQRVPRDCRKCMPFSPRKRGHTVKVLYSQKFSGMPSDFKVKDASLENWADECVFVPSGLEKLQENNIVSPPEALDKKIRKTSASLCGHKVKSTKFHWLRCKDSQMKIGGDKVRSAQKSLKVKKNRNLQNQFGQSFSSQTSESYISHCNVIQDEALLDPKRDSGETKHDCHPCSRAVVFDHSILYKCERTKCNVAVMNRMPITKGIYKEKIDLHNESTLDSQRINDYGHSEGKSFGCRLSSEARDIFESNKEMIGYQTSENYMKRGRNACASWSLNMTTPLNHHTCSPESKLDPEGFPSDKPLREVEKWRKICKCKKKKSKILKKAKYDCDKSDMRNAENKEKMFTSINGRQSNLNSKRAHGRGISTISKFHSKDKAKSLNQPVFRQDTITSLKNTKQTPKKKKHTSGIVEKRTKRMKKCYEILAESSKQSHRYIAKLLRQEIEQEAKQVEFTGIYKTTDGIESTGVEEMKLVPKTVVSGNENSSCRGRKYQQFDVIDEISESCFNEQIAQSEGTLAVHSSSGISASQSTAHRVICRKGGTSQPVDSVRSITDSLSRVSVSSSFPKQIKRKRTAQSMLAEYETWCKDTKRYSDGMSPSYVGQASRQMSTQALVRTGYLNNAAISWNKLNGAQKGNYCGKEIGESSTNSPSDVETVGRCVHGTGNFGHSRSYPYPEATENLSNAFLLQEIVVDNADLYENDTDDVHRNIENKCEAGNLLKNELAACCHSGERNLEEYDKGTDVNQTCLPQSKTETSAQLLGYSDSENFGISPSKCRCICALKSKNYGKDHNVCERNLCGIVGQPRNVRVTDEEDFTIGSATLNNLDKCEENVSHNSVCIDENYVCCIKKITGHDTTAGLDGAAAREDELTLESCENECHEKAKVQTTAYVSNTSLHTVLSENSVLSSLEELTEAAAARCDLSPLKTSSPNNSFDSDDEDMLSIYANSWTELDTDIEQENDKAHKQKKLIGQDDVTINISGKENDQIDNIGLCLKLHARKSKSEQEITPKINDNNNVTYDMPNKDYCERNLNIVDGKSLYDVGFDEDIWHSFGSRKYSRKDGVSESLYRETETPNKLEFGDSSCRSASFSERSFDGVVLLGRPIGECVQKKISDGKGNEVKADHYSKTALSSQSRENNIGVSGDGTFSDKIINSENYLSLLNSLQGLGLTENVGNQEEKNSKCGKEMKKKYLCVDKEVHHKNLADGGSGIMRYHDPEEPAGTRTNTIGRHYPAGATVQGPDALRNLNDLLESDGETAYLNEMKGIMGNTANYKGGKERRRLVTNVTSKGKRIRRKPWKGSKRPLLHHNIL